MEQITEIPHRILITGVAGAIGRLISTHLTSRGHQIRGFDCEPVADLADHRVGNLRERDAVRSAVAGIDTVIHLAAYRNDADFMEVLLEPNVVGLYEICEAAQLAGVQRLILASTIQVVNGFTAAAEPITVADGPLPTNHYALTKVWSELTGEMYARVHNLSVITARIGWFPRDTVIAQRIVNSDRGRDIYLSHGDAVRFFTCCVESPIPTRGTCVTLFATSRPTRQTRVDLTDAATAIGYVAQDQWPAGIPFRVPD